MAKRKTKLNKKKLVLLVSLLLSLALVVSLFSVTYVFKTATLDDFQTRGLWLSYQDLSSFHIGDEKKFKQDVQQLVKTMKKYELNTLYLQVRPTCDAIYDSDLFPMSSLISDRYDVDVLEEVEKACHLEKINIYAWINPYRVSMNLKTYKQFKDENIHGDWLNTKHIIKYGKYESILNPASDKARKYIVDGVEEILLNYKVDGIIFDDYFYVPKTHSSASKEKRLENVNTLIKGVYNTVHKYGKSFGVSCAGNYENCINDGADIDRWLNEPGYIDFLSPQFYWSDVYLSNGNQLTMFTNRIQQFYKIKRNKSITLQATLALYKCGTKDQSDIGWKQSSDNLTRQLQIIFRKYKGYSLYAYRHLRLKAVKEEMNLLMKDHQKEN